MMRRSTALLRRSIFRNNRSLCSAAAGANDSLKAAVSESWDVLIDAEWVDEEEAIPEIAQAEAVIDRYRGVYDGTEDELYRKMKDLYTAKEAAKVCELYTDHIDHLIREQEDATGVLGNETKITPELEESALKMITEYMEFATSFENDRIARKVESQLGKKIVIVRSALSIENFAAHVAPIACDTLVTDMK